MDSDAYVFFTKCHLLYIQGMRAAIQERLQSAFGDEWWERGVEHALRDERLDNLRSEVARNPDRDRRFFLDTPHFPFIISQHHKGIFSDAFPDALRVFKETRHITTLRNEWAHTQEISPARARSAAELMKSALASLKCEEALEVDRMSREFMPAYETDLPQEPEEGIDADDSEHDLERAADPWSLWRHLQSYLVLEQTVDLPQDSSQKARVVVNVHNTAPDSKDLPAVHFKSVRIGISGGAQRELGEMHPGATCEFEFSCTTNQLLGVEFEVFGDIDTGKLFHFSRMAPLPDTVLAPLREEFSRALESIAIKEFVNAVLEEIGTPDADMKLGDIARVRTALHRQQEQSEAKRTALAKLSGGLARESTLGRRTREIIFALVEFEKKLRSLDEAIGNTNIELINAAISDLKQAQLAVLRVEDTIKTMTASA